MTAARLTAGRLRQLADELPARYTVPLLHISHARVLTGQQLDRLLHDAGGPPQAATRARQRAMAHLARLGLVSTVNRRVGGVRAGSAGHVHTLTPAGHKLAAILAGRTLPAAVRRFRPPGPLAMDHALDVAEIYVQLVEASRTGGFQVAAFVTEPATWWPIGNGGQLRPDAYTVLDAGNYRDCWWLEIDRATESIPRLRDKLRDYRDHATYSGTGPDGVVPNILVTAPTPQRVEAIRAAITDAGLTDQATATTHDHAAALLVRELGTVDGQP